LNLGCAERSSPIEDPSSYAILPADDISWENAVSPSIYKNSDRVTKTIQEQEHFLPHRLSDPPTATMGRFCLTAQATILLGKILRNVNDESDQQASRDHEAIVLDNTIAALTNVSLQEGRFRSMGVCSPTTVCYRYEH
jgi:hypothetical protein